MTLVLPQSYIDEMVAHARDDAPNECCGMIASVDGQAAQIWRTKNAEESPFRYRIADDDLLTVMRAIDKMNGDLMVIYHSHLKHPAEPSPTDIRLARWPGSDPPMDMFPDTYYVLVSLQDADNPAVRAFKILDGVAIEEPLEAAET